ncbi:MAG: hypothetical protein ACKVX7_13635 [Planctomycetota bacterium]
MKVVPKKFCAQYATALRKHLASNTKNCSKSATGLGRRAVSLGLETLDLASTHKRALRPLLSALASTKARNAGLKSARDFFAAAVTPIEQTHRTALKAALDVDHLTRTLRRRTLQSSKSGRSLKRGIIKRQVAEKALRVSGHRRFKSLRASRQQEKHLRHSTRNLLAVSERDRQSFSHLIRNEIAQILLGIHVQLLALRRAVKTNAANLKQEFTNTRVLVKKSAPTISRIAREFWESR